MKHNVRIVSLLVGIFLLSQLMGLFIVNQYIDHEQIKQTGELGYGELPYDVERPEVEESQSVWYILIAVVLGTILLLIIIKFKKAIIWKVWYFLSVVVTLLFGFGAFVHEIIASVLAFVLAYLKVFKQKVWLHNFTELFIYGGLAAIFVPIMNLFAVVMLLIVISLYDMYAVWHSKHMVKLAEFTTESNLFAGLSIPYAKGSGKVAKKQSKSLSKKSKVKNAILGGGDIGFPLLFAGVVMKGLMLEYSMIVGFLITLIIPITTAIALIVLFVKGENNKFYPAMPFLSVGCFVGYAITLLF